MPTLVFSGSMRRRIARRSLFPLASSSLAALMIGNGAPPALAGACAISPVTNQSSVSNSGSINCINLSGITVTGNVTNTGTITPTGPTQAGIGIDNSSIGGTISNSGTITGARSANAIDVTGSSAVAGGIANSGTITASERGISDNSVSILAGGISNSGAISANLQGIFVDGVSTLAGGISNSGTVSSANASDIHVQQVSTFAGGINNSGTISANRTSIVVYLVSTFLGGITNSGTISSPGRTGILAVLSSSFAGGISNSGTISSANGTGIDVKHGLSFAGGINNSGTISAAHNGIFINVSAFTGGISDSGTISSALGTGISLQNATSFTGGITNTGTISGVSGIVVSGSGAVSVFDSGAIIGTGGTAVNLSGNAPGNTFTLGPGYGITGNVLGAGSDTFQLGGSGSGSFNLSTVGTQYTGFTTFNVVSGTWTATGTFGQSQAWNINGGTLAGTGTFAGINVNSGGTLQPGKAMTINGNLAFASGAIYLVQLSPTTASLAKVSGTATLTGGTVNAQFATGGNVSAHYTLLTATGGLGGTTFAALTSTNLPAGTSESLSYDAHDVYLNLTAPFSSYTGLSDNQQRVANALTNAFNSPNGIPAAFFALSRNGLTQIDGEAAAGGERSAFQMTSEFLNAMLDPFVDGRGSNTAGGPALGFAPEERARLPDDVARAYASVLGEAQPASFQQRWSEWGSAYGGSNTNKGDPVVGSNDIFALTYGVAGGLDYHFTPSALVGFALAGGGTNWGLANALGIGRSDALQVGGYGISWFGPAYIAGALSFSNHWFTTNRSALGDQLTANFIGQSYGARFEGGYRYGVTPTLGVTPYGAVQVQNFHTPAYSESDLTDGGFGLSYAAMDATDVRTEFGARFDAPTLLDDKPLILYGRAAWAHDFVSNPAFSAVFETLPGSSFTINGAPIPHDTALTTVGAQLFLAADWSLTGTFNGDFASGSQTYSGNGKLRYVW